MYIISDIGFFNIIQYPKDKAEGLLTFKARRKQDLLSLQAFTGPAEIETSDAADYPFRMKIPRDVGVDAIAMLVNRIDYPKTKDILFKHFPDRKDTYFAVWDTLTDLNPD